MNTAKGLALASNLPLVGVNHLEGHIYSAWVYPVDTAQPPAEPKFPLAGPAGFGRAYRVESDDRTTSCTRAWGAPWTMLPERRLIKLRACLGWHILEGLRCKKLPRPVTPQAFNFPRARLEGTWNFSFSGLKTAVLRVVKEFRGQNRPLPVEDLAASFQAAVVDVLVSKTLAAARSFKACGNCRCWRRIGQSAASGSIFKSERVSCAHPCTFVMHG